MNEFKKELIKKAIIFLLGFAFCFTLFYSFSPNIGGYRRSEKALYEQFNTTINELRQRNDGLREYLRQLENFNNRLGRNYSRLRDRESELASIAEERANIIREREASLERAERRLRELESIISKQHIHYADAKRTSGEVRDGLGDIIDELRELSGEQPGTNF